MTDTLRDRILHANETTDGSIYEDVISHNLKETPNDGIHYTETEIRDPYQKNFPYVQGSPIVFYLSSDKFDVDVFDKSFISMTAQATFTVSNIPSIGSSDLEQTLAKHQYVWVGLKASSHLIRQYQVWFNNVLVSTSLQSQAIFESFVYYANKSRNQLANKRYRYSDYKEVQEMDNSFVGFYVSLYELANSNGTITKSFPVVLKYDDLLPFQTLDIYPRSIFGTIKIEMVMSNEGFVWCPINPVYSIAAAVESGEIDASTTGLSEVLALIPSTVSYLRRFQQQGLSGNASFITTINSDTYAPTLTTNSITVTVASVSITAGRSNINGYRMMESVKQRLRYEFMSGAVFAAVGQICDVQQSTGAPSNYSLSAGLPTRFNHTTDITLLFPSSYYSRTVFQNIAANNFQVRIGERNFPERSDINTLSNEFHEMMIDASDFDSIFEANDSFEHALSDIPTDGTQWIQPRTDNTNFLVNFNLERESYGSRNVFFDGLHNSSLDVNITSVPIYQAYNPYGNGSLAPYIVCINEMYHIFSLTPNGAAVYQWVVNHTYEEAKNNRSIDAYNAPNILYA